jgi:hypothetical protein
MGREILSQLVERGLLTSDTPKGSVRIAFAPDYLDQLFPRLFYKACSPRGRAAPYPSRCSDAAGAACQG